MASKKLDQSSAGNHLLALEVDEAPFDRVEVNVVSIDASKGVAVDVRCCVCAVCAPLISGLRGGVFDGAEACW